MQVNDKYFLVENNLNNKHSYNDPFCGKCKNLVFERENAKIYGHAKNPVDTKFHLIDEVCLNALIQATKAPAVKCPTCHSSIDVSEKVGLKDRFTWPNYSFFYDLVRGALNGIAFTSGMFGSQVCAAGLGWESGHDKSIRDIRAICEKETDRKNMKTPEEKGKSMLDPASLDHEFQSCFETLLHHHLLNDKLPTSWINILFCAANPTQTHLFACCQMNTVKNHILFMALCGSILGQGLYFHQGGSIPIESSDLPSLFLGSALASGLSSAIGGCVIRFFQGYNHQ